MQKKRSSIFLRFSPKPLNLNFKFKSCSCSSFL
nr:MAG TPA: hypothetical protein [Caudoviricetes sp.]